MLLSWAMAHAAHAAQAADIKILRIFTVYGMIDEYFYVFIVQRYNNFLSCQPLLDE